MTRFLPSQLSSALIGHTVLRSGERGSIIYLRLASSKHQHTSRCKPIKSSSSIALQTGRHPRSLQSPPVFYGNLSAHLLFAFLLTVIRSADGSIIKSKSVHAWTLLLGYNIQQELSFCFLGRLNLLFFFRLCTQFITDRACCPLQGPGHLYSAIGLIPDHQPRQLSVVAFCLFFNPLQPGQ